MEQVADALGVSRQTIWRWAEEGKVKSLRVVKRFYVEEKSLSAYVGAAASKLLQVGQ